MSSDSPNSIHDTCKHHKERTCLYERNIANECEEESTNSSHCSAEEETRESGKECNWLLKSSDSDNNLDSNFEPYTE